MHNSTETTWVKLLAQVAWWSVELHAACLVKPRPVVFRSSLDGQAEVTNVIKFQCLGVSLLAGRVVECPLRAEGVAAPGRMW